MIVHEYNSRTSKSCMEHHENLNEKLLSEIIGISQKNGKEMPDFFLVTPW